MYHTTELTHWGILGMKWGVRRYQNPDGTLTEAGKKRYYKQLKRQYKWDVGRTDFKDSRSVSNRLNKKIQSKIKESYDLSSEAKNLKKEYDQMHDEYFRILTKDVQKIFDQAYDREEKRLIKQEKARWSKEGKIWWDDEEDLRRKVEDDAYRVATKARNESEPYKKAQQIKNKAKEVKTKLGKQVSEDLLGKYGSKVLPYYYVHRNDNYTYADLVEKAFNDLNKDWAD